MVVVVSCTTILVFYSRFCAVVLYLGKDDPKFLNHILRRDSDASDVSRSSRAREFDC